jgi:hypothetical protein
MSNIFDEKFKRAKVIPKFTDAKGKVFLNQPQMVSRIRRPRRKSTTIVTSSALEMARPA